MKIYLDKIYQDFKSVIVANEVHDKEEQLRIKKELEEKMLSDFSFEDFRKVNKIAAKQQSEKWFDRFDKKNKRNKLK